MTTMPTISEMTAHVTAKAAEDGDFRARLIADPKAVIASEFVVSIPENFAIKVHEDSASTAHMVLPLSDRLTEEDLALAAGGGWGDTAWSCSGDSNHGPHSGFGPSPH